MSLKNPVTPPGIDPGTVRLVAQRLNHYATPGPQYDDIGRCKQECIFGIYKDTVPSLNATKLYRWTISTVPVICNIGDKRRSARRFSLFTPEKKTPMPIE